MADPIAHESGRRRSGAWLRRATQPLAPTEGDLPAPMRVDKAAATAMVIGLGRFGFALSRKLEALGTSVVACDVDEGLIQRHRDEITKVVQMDATQADALRQAGATDVDAVVVAIGDDIEASILTTAALADLGVDPIWAKALTDEHGRILERVGAHHVVYPERDMGERLAHAISSELIEYFDIDEGFSLAESLPPRDVLGQTLAEAQLRQRYGVTVVAVKPPGGSFTYATPDTVLEPDAILLVAGETDRTRGFRDTQPRPAPRRPAPPPRPEPGGIG